MRIRKSTLTWLSLGFIWSIFMGITFVSMGLGSIFTALNRVAKPFVCPGGPMTLNSQYFQVSPVENVTTLTWYCVDEHAGTQTEINSFVINFYAGPFYGLLIFAAGLVLWYFIKRWDPSKETPAFKKRMVWVQYISIIVFVVVITLFNLMPLFRSVQPTPIPNATATSLAVTFETLTSGQPRVFSSTDKPLADWNGIPIMPQAIYGQRVNNGMYTFKVPEGSDTIETFYSDTLRSLGWNLEESRWLGLKFTKGKNTLLVTLAPASDAQSWIVSLLLIP